MSNKALVVFAAFSAMILAVQMVSCEDIEGQLPEELYILNPGSVFPVIVTDPDSPLLQTVDPQITIVCNVQRCQQTCRSWGYKYGRCNSQAICVCSNR